MPGDPNVCRERARECAELAARARNPEHKAMLDRLAQTWLSLADELERAHALLKAYPPDDSDGSEPPEKPEP
jgi:hypothetical protein